MQAGVLRISRGSVYYRPRPVPEAELAIMRRLDWLHLEFPFAGSRMLRGLLAAEGYKIGRRHVKTLMRRTGIRAIASAPARVRREVIECCGGTIRICGRKVVGRRAVDTTTALGQPNSTAPSNGRRCGGAIQLASSAPLTHS
jgi:hypothetical protein